MFELQTNPMSPAPLGGGELGIVAGEPGPLYAKRISSSVGASGRKPY